MAIQQVAASVQNDGNFSQLDLQDRDFGGPLMRIETFRCSQPSGEFGVTEAGTRVEYISGLDHLSSKSNRVFRHIFSVGDPSNPKVTLEIREEFDQHGSWEIRVRDLDPESESFGCLMIARATPASEGLYQLRYELLQQPDVERILLTSPLTAHVTDIVPGLNDIGASTEDLGGIDLNLKANPLEGELAWNSDYDTSSTFFNEFEALFKQRRFSTWSKNVQTYERFGDFRDKCIHPGINIVGSNPQLASEYIPIRAYRGSLIMIGRIFDPDMAKGGFSLSGIDNPLSIDPKPGVYMPFLSAYVLGIPIHQLGIDKVHSDYGGVPMALAPGSRLETGISPQVDSRAANQTLARLAVLFYQPQLSEKLVSEGAASFATGLQGALL